MRRLRELLAVTGALAIAFAAVLLGAPSAMAGGPTSVLVVSPESAQSAALYYSDEEYGELMRLLGEPGSGTREEPPGLGAAGHQLNVTWLVHDVSPWRVDRVYPDSPRSKDVWIHTTTDLPSMNGYWHKAEHPAQVRALFKKLGVLGKPSPEAGGGIFPAPWQTPEDSSTAPAPAEQPRTTTAARATADDDTDWWWAIPGAAAGAVLALLLRPLIAGIPAHRLLGRREHGTGPRQELRDV
ncbi:hypothetical protein AB0D27_06140 [Streptomyces sp. NPDC048415]|uniref:hypothetical protein n=1 Tax=Streptomyces sp. NPDC048415 TaxID=3154822 RepID=UPI003448C337